METVLAIIIALAVAGVGVIWLAVWHEKKQSQQIDDGSSASQTANGLSGNGSGVLEGDQSSTQDFSQYEKYKDSKQALIGEIKSGDGAAASAGKTVAIGYTGYLTNGQIFDKTTNKAFSFAIGAHQVIPGMEQGVVGMRVGGKRRIIIPPAAGYGNQTQGSIPANSVLIFDVELLAVQ